MPDLDGQRYALLPWLPAGAMRQSARVRSRLPRSSLAANAGGRPALRLAISVVFQTYSNLLDEDSTLLGFLSSPSVFARN